MPKNYIKYHIKLTTFNQLWFKTLNKQLNLPMKIKKYTVVRSVITSKHARDQYEIRFWKLSISQTLKNTSSTLISPHYLACTYYYNFYSTKFDIKLNKITNNTKF